MRTSLIKRGYKDMAKKNKNLIDDGFNAELVETAIFDGLLEIPTIKAPKEFILPEKMIPFSLWNRESDVSEYFGCFYEHDVKFRDILTSTKEYLEITKKFKGIISPDCSLYRDIPLILQMTNTYLNRQIGHYLQTQGIYVIPNVRWGDEFSYKRIIPTEKPFAFLGLEKKSIYCIGTYGCIKTKKDSYHFKEGLRSLIQELEPKIIIVYGSMHDRIFSEFKSDCHFVNIPDWITSKHQEVKNG